MKKEKDFPALMNEFNHLNIKIIENGVFLGDRTWQFNDVISNFNRMYFIMEGEAFLEDEQGVYPLHPGKLYLIPSGSKYNYRCTDFVKKFYLHFQLQFFPGFDLFENSDSFLVMDYESVLLDQILQKLDKNNPADLLSVKSILESISAQFLELALNRNPDMYLKNMLGYQRQKQIIQYITDHLNGELKVYQIAQYFCCSQHLISREFSKDMGIGLKDYIEKRLLMEAKYLLLTSTDTISQIAEQLKFCDAYYFSRFFKKYEQVSPREYRKRHNFYS